eukprot:Clim_evm51s215 gene=Clim_evmTU51s215
MAASGAVENVAEGDHHNELQVAHILAWYDEKDRIELGPRRRRPQGLFLALHIAILLMVRDSLCGKRVGSGKQNSGSVQLTAKESENTKRVAQDLSNRQTPASKTGAMREEQRIRSIAQEIQFFWSPAAELSDDLHRDPSLTTAETRKRYMNLRKPAAERIHVRLLVKGMLLGLS